MAYMTQEMKQTLSVGIKKVLADFGIKGTISIRHYSTLVVKIKKGLIDFDLSESGCKSVSFIRQSGKEDEEKKFLKALLYAMNNADDLQNYNDSEPMTDYFSVGWYVEIEIGSYKKPYVFEGSEKAA
jgi:hypothetical protein